MIAITSAARSRPRDALDDGAILDEQPVEQGDEELPPMSGRAPLPGVGHPGQLD